MLLAGAALSAARAEAAPVRVAIVVHPVVNVPDAESKAIAGELAAAMRKRYDAEIKAGDAVRTKLPANLPEACVSDPACVGQVGDRVAADQLLFVVLIKVGDEIQMDATWADIQSGRNFPRDTVQLPAAPAERSRVIAEIAPTMLPRGEVPVLGGAGRVDGKPETKTETKAETRLPPSTPADAWPTEERDVNLPAWISAGLSAASLGVGVALVLGGLADYEAQVSTGCPNQAEPAGSCVELVDRFGARSTAANLLLVGSALAAATSIALFAADAADDGTTAAVTVSPDGVGLAWGGRF